MLTAAMRAAVRVLAGLAPETAARWFERQMMRPRRVPQLPLEPPSAAAERQRLPFGATHLALSVWGEGPAVLLVHGWGSTTRSFWRVVDPLVARGLRVAALDLPAHGGSGGRRTNMLECAEAVLRAGDVLGPLRGVIAHSFGAPAAALAVRRGLAPARLVMVAPPLSVYAALRQVALEVGVPDVVFQRMARGMEERLRFRWAELATDALVSALHAPLLVVHDEEDRVVPWSHGAAVARAARRGALLTTGGLGHRAVLAHERVVAQMVDFVAAEAARLDREVAGADPDLARAAGRTRLPVRGSS